MLASAAVFFFFFFLRRFFVFILVPDPLGTNRMIKKDELQEHMAAIKKGSTNNSTITKDCMLGLWDMNDEPASVEVAPVAVEGITTISTPMKITLGSLHMF